MVTAYYGKNGGKSVLPLRRELLPQFFTNSHEIWHRCLRWGVDVQDTFFWQWQKVCCHGNGICQKLRGKCISNQIWHTCSRWSVAVHDTFWDSGGMCIAMVTAYYSKNWKTKHFTSNSKEIGFTCWPWGIDVQETFLRMGKMCCHGNNICQQLRGKRIFKLNLAHMFALKCRCVGHILGQWQNVCCHGNGILFQKLKNKTYCDAMNNCAGWGY